MPCKEEEDEVRCSLTYSKLRLSKRKTKFYLDFSGPTNEARAEGKLVFILPCKEEEDEVNRWSSERRAECIRAIPSRDRGRRSQRE